MCADRQKIAAAHWVRRTLCQIQVIGLVMAIIWLSGCGEKETPLQARDMGPIPENPKSGYYYQSTEEQALQDDKFANPGFLWVDEGKALFEDDRQHPSCASCHAEQSNLRKESWQTAATRYPAFDSQMNRVITLEERINHCRSTHQNLPPLDWETRELLALTAFVANRAQGVPIAIQVTDQNQESLRRGAAYYNLRKGQLNLACRHCHEQNPGRMLRGDRLSEGLPTGYPAYKLEWQDLGSLQRRLRDCDIGVRAQPHPYGAQVYADLELYLKLRGNQLQIDTPAVRR